MRESCTAPRKRSQRSCVSCAVAFGSWSGACDERLLGEERMVMKSGLVYGGKCRFGSGAWRVRPGGGRGSMNTVVRAGILGLGQPDVAGDMGGG